MPIQPTVKFPQSKGSYLSPSNAMLRLHSTLPSHSYR